MRFDASRPHMGASQGIPEVYRFVVRPLSNIDPRSTAYLQDAQGLGLTAIQQIECHDLYFIEGCLTEDEIQRLASRLLFDPLTQEIEWRRFKAGDMQTRVDDPQQRLIEVALRPGVTDPTAEQIVRAAHVLGLQGVNRASTGQRFLISGEGLVEETLQLLAGRLLANPIIQRFTLGTIEPVFPQPAEATGNVEWIPIRGLDAQGLLSLSQDRRAALDLEEMLAIQSYYQSQQRDMTDIEFETIAQTWSEHCVHKTFRALISLEDPAKREANPFGEQPQIDNLLRTYLRAATERIHAPWVRSAFVDNAGIIDFDEMHEISFKVETHNHPSAIEPFGGANTGIGGVIRDVIGVSAKPIAATDVLCFGPAGASFADLPAGVLHPRRIRSGVIAGIQDYGNKIGIPTVSGAVVYDPGFTSNPLVFCGCVGIAPKNSHPREPLTGDHVIVLGGRTGRDGLRGATFSSMTMDAQTGEVAGASVQIGAPIVEKGLIDVTIQARDSGIYHAITDCGAGGLSSAVGEMSSEIGAEIHLDTVRLKYPGLSPWEIWLSEAQERMVLAVPEPALPQLQALCETYEVEMTDIGVFTGSGRLVVRYDTRPVLDLSNEFLHHGIPQRKLSALLPPSREIETIDQECRPLDDYAQITLRLLAHPNIASKAPVIRIYDHEVQGGTVVKPLTGAMEDGPSDAAVIKPTGTTGPEAIVLAAGINPEYGKNDPYRMTVSVIDEAIRNAVAVGCDPHRIALLDNFCWGDPRNPETLGSLVESARACYDAACYYQTPFISGKDSLNNEYMGTDGRRHAIPPTLLISAIGILPDLTRSITMDIKQPGNRVYRIGDYRPCLGGSHYAIVTGEYAHSPVPGLPAHANQVYAALYEAIQQGWVRACHDLSEGGLVVAAAEMCIGGRLGLDLALPGEATIGNLFGETNGCLLVEVDAKKAAPFEALFSSLPCQHLGTVTAEPILSVGAGQQALITLPVDQLVAAWQSTD